VTPWLVVKCGFVVFTTSCFQGGNKKWLGLHACNNCECNHGRHIQQLETILSYWIGFNEMQNEDFFYHKNVGIWQVTSWKYDKT